jgi:hypothetical protein
MGELHEEHMEFVWEVIKDGGSSPVGFFWLYSHRLP